MDARGKIQIPSFNPYRVFKFVATKRNTTSFGHVSSVSIPIGFSSSLQHQRNVTTISIGYSFNPYRVFKFVATGGGGLMQTRRARFQSLSGFQVRCNALNLTKTHLPSSWFQSLSGFQVRCNADISIREKLDPMVSIPIGFSSSLQPDLLFLFLPYDIRFNPYRVFKFVATSNESLPACAFRPVSIPIGFSSSLQHPDSFSQTQ